MFDDAGNGPRPEEIVAKITSLGAKCTIGEELAPTTNRKHYHVYVHKPEPFNTRNQKAFDIVTYHPNIKLITSRHENVWDYVVKSGNILVQDVDRPQPARKGSTHHDEVFRSAFSQPTFDSMLRTIEVGAPSKFATSYLSIRALAKDRFTAPVDAEYTHPRDAPFDTSDWPELAEWIQQYLPNSTGGGSHTTGESTPSLVSGDSSDCSSLFSGESGWVGPEVEEDQTGHERYDTPKLPERPVLSALQPRPKSLILWGPTRTGKTCWARSLGSHTHHANTVNMGLHRDDVSYTVFDDITGGIKAIDYKAWLGGQLHFTVTDKYMKKKTITWGKPCIYLANENPYTTDRNVDFEWLAANTVIVNIDKRMY